VESAIKKRYDADFNKVFKGNEELAKMKAKLPSSSDQVKQTPKTVLRRNLHKVQDANEC
jgi:hypothetical protein